MGDELLDKLRVEVAAGRVVFVVGAGVSIGATGGNALAGWPGLLENGVGRCVELLGSKLPKDWGDRQLAAVRSTDLDDVLGVAEQVERKLRGIRDGVYGAWLRDTVGALKATDTSVLSALHATGCPLATTNYDDLLSTTELRPITWLSGEGAQAYEFVRGERRAILQLHGHWEEPKSIVLGLRSYFELLKNELAQNAARALATTKTLVFVGFGAGLEDPNFEALREWMTRVHASVRRAHYRLALNSELAALQAQHGADCIEVIACGKEHGDLAPFLGSLRPKQSQQPKAPSPNPTRAAVLARAFASLSSLHRAYTPRDLDENKLFSAHQGHERYFPLRVGRLPELGEDSHVAEFARQRETPQVELVPEKQIFASGTRWILRGGPGSGKSTLVAHLARSAGADRVAIVLSLSEWIGAKLDPCAVLATALIQPETQPLFPDIKSDDLAEWLRDRVRAGQALIVLDGWDELGRDREGIARDRIRHLLNWPGVAQCTVVVTTRPGPSVQVPELGAQTLDVLPVTFRATDENEDVVRSAILHFIGLYVGDSKRAHNVLTSIAEHPELSELRDIPFVLSLVAWLTKVNLRLPLRLVELYQLAIHEMLQRPIGTLKDQSGGNVRDPLEADVWHALLDEIAYRSFNEFGRAAPTRESVLRVIRSTTSELCGSPIDGAAVLRWLSKSTVLHDPGKSGARVYWLHSSIFEFLLARWLARGAPLDQRNAEARGDQRISIHAVDDPEQLVKCNAAADRILRRDIWTEPYEVLLSFYGRLVSDARRANMLSVLGGEQIAIPKGLGGVVRADKRVAVLDLVGHLGSEVRELDPRLTEQRRWVTIPKGPFWYGAEKRASREDEHNYEFALQRWPVTVGEYAGFVDDWDRGGRERVGEVLRLDTYPRRAGADDAWIEVLKSIGVGESKENDRFSLLPTDVDRLWWERQKHRRWNHPMVLVDWFQAWAYCAWLTALEWRGFPATNVVLPTAAEWERAARAMQSVLTDSAARDPGESDYPWRGPFDADRANTEKTGLGRTSPVGAFPGGNSGCGLWDMSGDVWEWCADPADYGWRAKLNQKGSSRVMHGGGFRSVAVFARCSIRFAGHPAHRLDDIGFRPARVATEHLHRLTPKKRR